MVIFFWLWTTYARLNALTKKLCTTLPQLNLTKLSISSNILKGILQTTFEFLGKNNTTKHNNIYKRQTLSTSSHSVSIRLLIMFVIPLIHILSPQKSEPTNPHPYTSNSTSSPITLNPKLKQTSTTDKGTRCFHMWKNCSPSSHRRSSSTSRGMQISKDLSNSKHHLKGVSLIRLRCPSVNTFFYLHDVLCVHKIY